MKYFIILVLSLNLYAGNCKHHFDYSKTLKHKSETSKNSELREEYKKLSLEYMKVGVMCEKHKLIMRMVKDLNDEIVK